MKRYALAWMGNLARFTINGTPSDPPGYDSAPSEAWNFRLESPAGTLNRWELQVYDASVPDSPPASFGAPSVALVGTTTGSRVTATTPAGLITGAAPTDRSHSYKVRSLVNGGVNPLGNVDPDYVFERIISLRATNGLRKIVDGEETEYAQKGIADAQNQAVDLGGGAPGPAGAGVIPAVDILADSNVAVLNTVQTINGISTSGKRILLAGQTTQSQNGPYTCPAGAGAWVSDFASDAAVAAAVGQPVYIKPGGITGQDLSLYLQSGVTRAAAKVYAAQKTNVPVPDYVATSNVTINGSQTVDGATPATGKVVLCVAQTNPAENGYQVVNTAGSWTRPRFYNSDALIAALLGVASGAALNGALNKGATYYQQSGATLAGAKLWVPTKAPAVINVADAPWFIVADDSDQTAGFAALQTYLTAQTALGHGGTVMLGAGTTRCTQRIDLPRRWSFRGPGQLAACLHTPAGNGPVDTLRLAWRVDAQADQSGTIGGFRILNETVAPVWAANTVYAPGNRVRPINAHPYELLCTVGGTSAARPPLGELTPWGFISKLVGVSNADCSPIWKVITPGQLGTMQFQVSTDGGLNWGATQTTVAQPGRDCYVYTIPGFGTLGIQFADVSYPAAATIATSADFTQPLPGVFHPVSIALLNTANIALGDGYLTPTGGLYLANAAGAGGAGSVAFINAGTPSNAANGTTITAGHVLSKVHVPQPRIEVIGTPPGSDPVVDVTTQWGQLDTMQFTVGYADTVEKNKNGIAVTMGSLQSTTPGAYSDYVIPGTGSALTLRCHTGIYRNATGAVNYWSARPGWSMQAGSLIKDGATLVWQLVQGSAQIRVNNIGQLKIDDYYGDGGTCGIVDSSGYGLHIEGSGTIVNTPFAPLWFTNGDGRYGEGGQFTNQCVVSGTLSLFHAANCPAVIHDGGSGFTVHGTIGFNGAGPWMYGASVFGMAMSGVYIECKGAQWRDTSYVSGIPGGTGMLNPVLHGGYFASISDAFAIDMYQVRSPKLCGLWGGATAAIKVDMSVIDLDISGMHKNGLPLVSGTPFSGGISSRTAGTATLAGGFATISNATITATSVIAFWLKTPANGGLTVKFAALASDRVVGSPGSFKVTALLAAGTINNVDTSTIDWEVIG